MYKIIADLHTHSIASGHATTDTIASMARQAAAMGLDILGITDHGPATPLAGTLSYFRSLFLAPRKRDGVFLCYGAEANILDQACALKTGCPTDSTGLLDLTDDVLSGLDYVIASLHPNTCHPGSMEVNTGRYLAAISNPYVKIIGHCDDVRYPVCFETLVQAAKKHRVLLEINDASLAPGSYRGDTSANNKKLLQYCMKYSHPVLLSSDSHGVNHVGDFSHIYPLLQDCQFPDELIVNYHRELLEEYLLLHL